MFKKMSFALAIIFALFAALAGYFLYSDDQVVVTLSRVPDGGLTEPSYLVRSSSAGNSRLTYPLVTTHGITPVRVVVSEGKPLGKEGLFVKSTESGIPFINDDRTLAVIAGSEFHNGTIEVEMNGDVSPNASRLVRKFARGFIGVCFHISDNTESFECFYLRPVNGQSDDPVRKDHAVQYSSVPDWNFARLRKEAPEKYENPANITPGKWHKIRIDVTDQKAQLFIDQEVKPVLVVGDLKLGSDARGEIGLWVGPGTNGFFKNLVITKTD